MSTTDVFQSSLSLFRYRGKVLELEPIWYFDELYWLSLPCLKPNVEGDAYLFHADDETKRPVEKPERVPYKCVWNDAESAYNNLYQIRVAGSLQGFPNLFRAEGRTEADAIAEFQTRHGTRHTITACNLLATALTKPFKLDDLIEN